MSSQGFVVGVCDMGLALVVILLSVPLVKGSISRNAFYGVCTRVTLVSDENWYRANAYGGNQLIIWSIPMFLAGAAAFFYAFWPGAASAAYSIGGARVSSVHCVGDVALRAHQSSVSRRLWPFGCLTRLLAPQIQYLQCGVFATTQGRWPHFQMQPIEPGPGSLPGPGALICRCGSFGADSRKCRTVSRLCGIRPTTRSAPRSRGARGDKP